MVLQTNLFIFLFCCVLAILEIQIEGPHGWAKNLPTWRGEPHQWYTKLYARIMSGKELTGYHLSMFGLVLMIFLLPFFLGEQIIFPNLFKNLILYFFVVPLWDFLWFVFNPYYPLKHFQKDNVVHKDWLFGMPVDYYFSVSISLILAIIASAIFPDWGFFHWWLTNFILFIFETSIVIMLTLNVLKIDNWRVQEGHFRSFHGK